MWPRLLLYAAEVALKLQLCHLNRRLFSGAIRRSRERTGCEDFFAWEDFHKGCGFYYLSVYYLSFNYLYVYPFQRRILTKIYLFQRRWCAAGLSVSAWKVLPDHRSLWIELMAAVL